MLSTSVYVPMTLRFVSENTWVSESSLWLSPLSLVVPQRSPLYWITPPSFQAVLAGDLGILLDILCLLTAHIQPPPTSVASTLMYISDGLVSVSSLLSISFQSCHHSFPGYYQCLLVIFCKFFISILATHSLHSRKCNLNSAWIMLFSSLKLSKHFSLLAE